MNDVACDGGTLAVCTSGDFIAYAATSKECSGVDVFLGRWQELVLHFHVDTDGAVTFASARLSSSSIESIDLAIAYSSSDSNARHAGEFSLWVEDVLVAGAYDTFGVHGGPWFIVDTLMPLTSDYALNLDADGLDANRGDARLTDFLLSLRGYSSSVQQHVADGRLSLGFAVSSDVSADTSATGVYVTGGPLLPVAMQEEFVLSLEEPAGFLVGTSVLDDLVVGPGRFRLPVLLSPDGIVADLPVRGARLDADLSADGLAAGTLGAGIAQEDIANVLVPAMHASFTRTLDQHCDAVSCTSGSAGEQLLAQYDNDNDRSLSLEEVSSALATILTPDVDVIATTGAGGDGEVDSLSLGVSFSSLPTIVSVRP